MQWMKKKEGPFIHNFCLCTELVLQVVVFIHNLCKFGQTPVLNITRISSDFLSPPVSIMALQHGTPNISHFGVKQLCLKNEFWRIVVIIIIFLNFDLYEDVLVRISILELSSLTLLIILLKLLTVTQLILWVLLFS